MENQVVKTDVVANYFKLQEELKSFIQEFLNNGRDIDVQTLPMFSIETLTNIMKELGYELTSTKPISPKTWKDDFFLQFTKWNEIIDIDGNLWYGQFKIRKGVN